MLEGMLRKPTIVGDITFVSGTVIDKQVRNDKGVVIFSLVAKNQNGEETVVGKAEVELLARTQLNEGERQV
jgi:acyl dehydratase